MYGFFDLPRNYRAFPINNFLLIPVKVVICFPAVKDLEKKETDEIYAIASFKLQNSKPSKVNLSKDEHKALKELQSNASIVILPAGKGRSTIILNREDYLEKIYGSYKQWSISIT